jgi:hypothetical protein
MTFLQDFNVGALTSRYNFMTNPDTAQPSELKIKDFNNRINYVLVIFDHPFVSE